MQLYCQSSAWDVVKFGSFRGDMALTTASNWQTGKVQVRTDIFAATFEELRDYDVSPDGPAEDYPTIEAEHLDVPVLWELCRILIDTDLETFMRDTHLVSGGETPTEIDLPTVELLPSLLIDALLSISAEDLMWVAERWADIPDWREEHSINDLAMTLISLVQLAAFASENDRLLFLWTCFVESEVDEDSDEDEDDEEQAS